MSDDLVLIERPEEGLVLLTLNRPDKRNALNLALVTGLGRVLDELEGEIEEGGEGGLRAVILKGAGDKAFVAGADIAELEQRDAVQSLAGINSGLFRKVEEFPVPVLAAIHGWTLGGGMELVMACDIRIADPTARFGQPELNLGILPAAGGMHRLPALVGMGIAKDLVLTGRILDAEEALSAGLVSRIVPEESLLEETLAAARQVAGMGSLATRLAKGILNSLFRVRPDTAALLESSAQAILFETDEKHRRMRAFLDRKKG